MPHHCHAHGCRRVVPPRKFVCPHHWARLTFGLKAAILQEYRTGQEKTKTPTVRYLAVQRYAVGYLAFADFKSPIYAAPYLAESQIWRVEAIEAGQGDPLQGVKPHLPGAPDTPEPAPFTHAQASEAWQVVYKLREQTSKPMSTPPRPPDYCPAHRFWLPCPTCKDSMSHDKPTLSPVLVSALMTHLGISPGDPDTWIVIETALECVRQVTQGKGKERHQRGRGFKDQPILVIPRMLGGDVGLGGLLYQAIKKAEESVGMEPTRRVAELRGAVIYLLAAIIHEETRPR